MSDDQGRSELDPLTTTTDSSNGVGPHDDDVVADSDAESTAATAAADSSDAGAESPDLLTRLADAMRQTVETERSRVGDDIDRRRTEYLAAIAARRESEATRMRELAADDRGAIERWADGERQRIQKERDEKLAAVEADLATSLEEHAKSVDAQVERIESAISAHRADVDRFFGSLASESDPVRIAQVAGQRPAFPNLDTASTASAATAPAAGSSSTTDEPVGEAVMLIADTEPESDGLIGASDEADLDDAEVTTAAEAAADVNEPTGMPVMDPIARLGLLKASDQVFERPQPRPVPAGAWRPSGVEAERDQPAPVASSGGFNRIGWIRRKDDSADR